MYVQAMLSEGSLDLVSPHLTRPPRVSSVSPIPAMYTPSKGNNNNSGYENSSNYYSPRIGSPMTTSPSAGFFSPTAATPRDFSKAFHQSEIQLNHDPASNAEEQNGNYNGSADYLDEYAEEISTRQVVESPHIAFDSGEYYDEVVGPPQSDPRSINESNTQDSFQRHQRAPSVSSLSDDQSDGSSSAITPRHLEVWNKFFENAIKSDESRKIANKRKYMLEQYGAPSGKQGSLRNKASAKQPLPTGIKPIYTPVEKYSSNKNSKGVEMWPEKLAEDVYSELITESFTQLSSGGRSTYEDGAEQYVMNESGEYVPNVRGPSKEDFMMGSVALIAATAHGDVDTVENLLMLGVYPSCVDSHIRTPLHHAAHQGS